MNTFILTFDILRTTDEMVKLQELFGENNLRPVGINCHAYLIKFNGTAEDLRAFLLETESVYPYEEFFIAEVGKWSAALRGQRKVEMPVFLGSAPELQRNRIAYA
jgi:hypothetical protein